MFRIHKLKGKEGFCVEMKYLYAFFFTNLIFRKSFLVIFRIIKLKIIKLLANATSFKNTQAHLCKHFVLFKRFNISGQSASYL